MQEEKRLDKRISVYLPINYDILGTEQKELGSTTSKDLSLRGIKILTEKFFPPGTKFLLKLNLKDIDKMLELMAQSRWSSNIQFSNRYQSGLSFEDLNPQYKKALEEYIKFKQAIKDKEESSSG